MVNNPNNNKDNDAPDTENQQSYKDFFNRLPDSITPPKLIRNLAHHTVTKVMVKWKKETNKF